MHFRNINEKWLTPFSVFVMDNVMRLKLFTVIIAVIVLLIPFEMAYIYRLSSKERVMTRGAVLLKPGMNRLYLSLPRGSYVCAFSVDPNLTPSFTASPNDRREIHVNTEIIRGGRRIVNSDAQWIKFNVKDDGYSVVDIEITVQQESANPVYVIIGGTF